MVKLSVTKPLDVVYSHIGRVFGLINPTIETGPFAGQSLYDIRKIYSRKRGLLADGYDAWPYFDAPEGSQDRDGISSLHVWLAIRFFSLMAHGRKPVEADWSAETLDSEFLNGFKNAFGKHLNGMVMVEPFDLRAISHSSAHLNDLEIAMAAARNFADDFLKDFSLNGVVAIRQKKKLAVPPTPIRQQQVFGKSRQDMLTEPPGPSAEILLFRGKSS